MIDLMIAKSRLKKSQDAYGHSLWDYFYKKQPACEIIERSDGYIDPSDVAPKIYFSKFEDWPDVEKKAIKFAKGRVLDVGCGAGRVAIYLQDNKRLDVLGIDLSLLAIRVCKQRGLRKVRLLAFEDVDFKPGSFDSVVLFGNNFGLFGSRARAKLLLKKLFTMTSANAVIIGESVNPYETDNPYHLEYQRINRAKGRMSGQIRIRARYKYYIGRWFDYLLVSPKEMKELCEGTGWRVKRFILSKKDPLYVGILMKV